MLGKKSIVGLCIVGAGILVAASSSAAGPAARPSPRCAPQSAHAAGHDEGVAAEGEGSVARGAGSAGLSTAAVSVSLAAQLGLEPGVGVLVQAVEAGGPAARAGLAVHDVIATIDGRPARPEALAAVVAQGSGAALGVLRGGQELDVALCAPEGSAAPGRFLSSASLAPDHPLRRLARIEELRERTGERAQEAERRRRELDQELREARSAAQSELQQLGGDTKAAVAELLEEHRRRLLAYVDAQLGGDAAAGLNELAVDLGALDEASLAAVNAALQAARADLESAHAERMQVLAPGGSGKLEGVARKRVQRVGDELSGLVAQRLERPWSEALRELERARGRLGEHAQQVQRAAELVDGIRGQVRERIECAIERTNQEFGKRLDARLRAFELPRPGEIDAALEDLVGQLDAWTRRFCRRTHDALALCDRGLRDSRTGLAPALVREFEGVRAASLGVQQAFDDVLGEALGQRLVLDETWHAQGRTDALVDGLDRDLRRALLDGREGVHVHADALSEHLHRDDARSDEAWDDLWSALRRLHKEASNDCWKLDGPHLDGRFPRPSGQPEDEGDVARL